MDEIKFHEVGLRDGLQMESELIPFENKVYWAEALAESGLDIIQLGSFVHPKKIPQMADADELFDRIKEADKYNDVVFSGLVLNEKGYERGMACGVDMFCMGVSASETHSEKNTGMKPREAQKRIISIAKKALADEKLVQVSVQSAFGCGFEGDIPEERVYDLVKAYLDAGARIVSLADTAGHANPQKVERMILKIKELDKDVEIACHFHDTYGMGAANVYAAFKAGAKYFETAFGGLGGCPFTKIAAGNVASEDIINMFQEMGIRKDIDVAKIASASKAAGGFFIRDFPGKVYRTGTIRERVS